MKIDPKTVSVQWLLNSGHQFIIPRFQREYSWETKNNEEFLRDVISNIEFRDGKLVTQPYFVGAMLFVGDLSDSTQKEIQVVDGQQRLTTITIMFSVISDIFMSLGLDDLSTAVFKFVMTDNVNGKKERILMPKSSYPFFSYYIQFRDKKEAEEENSPGTEEEVCIKDTYEYFHKQLQESYLRKLFVKHRVGSEVEMAGIEYVELIKAIRDQILACVAVTMSSADEKQAYRIFEILNGKGKKLQFVDLIKNRIFEIVQDTEPYDFAEVKWAELRKIVSESDANNGVGLGTFYRHYWQSKYGRAGTNQLYDAFKETIPVSTKSYKDFLKDLLKNAQDYIKIVHPQREDYNNRKQYFGVVQSFNALSNYFAVAQVRVVILALMDCKERGLISLDTYKSVIRYLENFHFVYNGLMTGRANVLDSIYSHCAIELRKASDKVSVRDVLQRKLYVELDKFLPDFESFKEKFVKLEYTKYKDSGMNVRCKYVIQKLYCHFERCELNDDYMSIEHLLPEKTGGVRYNIGNLIALEIDLNTEADDKGFVDKCAIYSSSKYQWIHDFMINYPNWDESMIMRRAEALAEIYYYEILKRPRP